MKKCFFCGESNVLVLENAHLVPRCIKDHVMEKSQGQVNVEKTITLCRNCHKKFETLLKPFVKYCHTKREIDSNVNNNEKTPIVISGRLNDVLNGTNLTIYNAMGEHFTFLPLYDRSLIDDALQLAKNGREGMFTVKNGVIIKIEPSPKQSETSRTPSLVDRLYTVLRCLVEMEREVGMVAKEDLMERLMFEVGMDNFEFERLFNQLRKEGTIYCAREGYWKKT